MTRDPLLDRVLDIQTDLLVLATGIVPHLPPDLAAAFGATVDPDGFFAEAESKWRPVDALKEGVFCLRAGPVTAFDPEIHCHGRCRGPAYLENPVPRNTGHGKGRRLGAPQPVQPVRAVYRSPVPMTHAPWIRNRRRCGSIRPCARAAVPVRRYAPNGASVVFGFGEQQMLDVIDAALEGTGNVAAGV